MASSAAGGDGDLYVLVLVFCSLEMGRDQLTCCREVVIDLIVGGGKAISSKYSMEFWRSATSSRGYRNDV